MALRELLEAYFGGALVTKLPLKWFLEYDFKLFWALVARVALRWSLEAHFEQFWALVTRMAHRWFMEAYFKVFCGLGCPGWLSGDLRRLVLI